MRDLASYLSSRHIILSSFFPAGPHEHGQRDGERGLDLEGLQVFGAPLHRQHGPQEGEALRAKFEKIIRNLANIVIDIKVRLSLGLNGSNFEAKGGIVGGSVNVGRINTLCQLNEDMDVEPFHKLGLQVGNRKHGIIYPPYTLLSMQSSRDRL